jgi:hypothetical protein
LRVECHASAHIAACRSSSPILPVLSRAGLAFGPPTLLPLLRLSATPVVLAHTVGLTALLTLLRAVALRLVALRTLAHGPILLTLRAFSTHLVLFALLRLALLRRSIAGSRSLASRGTASILRGTLGATLWHLRAGRAWRRALRALRVWSAFLRARRHSLLGRAALGRLRRGQGDAHQERSGTQ